jgi:hypothetical protein
MADQFAFLSREPNLTALNQNQGGERSAARFHLSEQPLRYCNHRTPLYSITVSVSFIWTV